MTGTTNRQAFEEPEVPLKEDLGQEILRALSHLTVCSKEPIIRQYDHRVQGGTILYSLTGKIYKSPSDAIIVEPLLGRGYGLAVAHGLNPILNRIDPYYGSLWAILEAVSNMVATGVNPANIALIDNFIWPKPDEESLADLDRAVDACVDASKILKMPFISGKDSLNSTYRGENRLIKIPPVLCVSAFARVEDVRKTISSCFKKSGNKIVVVGNTKKELGGSVYYDNHGKVGNSIPKPDPHEALTVFHCVYQCIAERLVESCHDVSEGGIAVALPEMCFVNQLGAKIELSQVPVSMKEPRADYLLFSESSNRFLLEVTKENLPRVKNTLAGVPFSSIGEVSDSANLAISYNGNQVSVADISELLEVWEQPMKLVFGK
jgi:phosphoribosylformylglycinamidine synthase